MLHLLISSNRTWANDSNSGAIEGPFFWDTMLHQWVIGSQCFEGVHDTFLKGLTGPSLQMRALCSLKMSGFHYRLAQLPVPEEWHRQAYCCKNLTSGTVGGLTALLCKGTSSKVTAWNRW
jgi:hypothetical protein